MATLNQLRERIKKIDSAIIKKIAERQRLSKEIGLLKHKTRKRIVDLTREQDLMEYYENLCVQYHLQPSIIKRLFKIIIVYSRKLQK